MHIYIYDIFLNAPKYQEILSQIEIRLTDLGLNGKIIRMGALRSIRAAVETELKRGAKTVVAVGNDKTANEVAAALAGNGVPLGIIPIGEKNNSLAAALGIGEEQKACDALSARRIEKIDLGTANNQCFIANASIPSEGTLLNFGENECQIETLEKGIFTMLNFQFKERRKNFLKADPQDGLLELFIETEKKGLSFFKNRRGGPSVFFFKKLEVQNKNKAKMVLDGSNEIKTPVKIGVLKQGLSLIVGKNRVF